jgi:single-strand DNA-binding protein
MNTGTFAGYIGRDAETKQLPSGQSVTNFSLAISTGWGDKKSTLWVGCALWGERGEKLCQYLTKGSAVSVSGDVDVRAYKSKDGEAKAEMTCNVQRVTLQGGGDRGERVEPQPNREPAEKTPQQREREANSATVDKDFDDDLPF